MIYVDDEHSVVYCGENEEDAKKILRRDAEKYFNDNPEMNQFKMCLIDLDKNVSTVYVFEQQRNITCTQY